MRERVCRCVSRILAALDAVYSRRNAAFYRIERWVLVEILVELAKYD